MRAARLALAAALAASAACADLGPPSGPGRLRATLVSPNGPEGAAVVLLAGEGIGEVQEVGATRLWRSDGPGTTRLVLVNEAGGEIAFDLQLADTTRVPSFVVEQVSAVDDALRADPSAYRVELTR